MASTPDLPKPFPRGPDPRDEAPTVAGGVFFFRRYRLLRELGRGGMGVVLLAHDTALGIDVAVKLVPDLVVQDTEAMNGLRKEVLRGIALAHPGIVRTHNFERDEASAGIVMEFVEGDTLHELKAAQPGQCFDPAQILDWIEQLCAVLDYAHRDARIVHRDLKPRNIMLNRAGKIKVADFGIAAVISDSMTRHTIEGKVIGTLSYMSPQQAQGLKPSVPDDIHALGATIYELLTGKAPFFRGNQAAIFQQILHVVPPAMAERREDLEVVAKAPIPRPWEETIAACLAKEPARRPQSAGEVWRQLRAARLTSRPALSAPRAGPSPTLAPPLAETEREITTQPATGAPPRSRAAWGWGALTTLVLVAGSAYHFMGEHSTAPAPEPARPAPAPTPAPARPPTPAPTPLPTPVPTPLPAPKPTPTPPRAELAITPRTLSAETPRSDANRVGTPKAGKPSADKNDPVREAIERQYRSGNISRDQYLKALKNL